MKKISYKRISRFFRKLSDVFRAQMTVRREILNFNENLVPGLYIYNHQRAQLLLVFNKVEHAPVWKWRTFFHRRMWLFNGIIPVWKRGALTDSPATAIHHGTNGTIKLFTDTQVLTFSNSEEQLQDILGKTQLLSTHLPIINAERILIESVRGNRHGIVEPRIYSKSMAKAPLKQQLNIFLAISNSIRKALKNQVSKETIGPDQAENIYLELLELLHIHNIDIPPPIFERHGQVKEIIAQSSLIWSHTDLHGENIFSKGEGQPIIIDPDLARPMPSFYDPISIPFYLWLYHNDVRLFNHLARHKDDPLPGTGLLDPPDRPKLFQDLCLAFITIHLTEGIGSKLKTQKELFRRLEFTDLFS